MSYAAERDAAAEAKRIADGWQDVHHSDGTMRVAYKPDSHWMEFRAWVVPYRFSPADPDIEGHVKWDGCMSIEGSIHLCGPDQADMVARLIRFAYYVASEKLTSCDFRPMQEPA